MKRLYSALILILSLSFVALANEEGIAEVTIHNPQTWRSSDLSQYVGQTIIFRNPWYICNNYSGYYISPRRIYSPTNQAIPMSSDYSNILSLNANGTIALNGVDGYHRMGEKMYNLKVKVNSNSLSFVSCDWIGNTREEMEKGFNISDVDAHGQHSLLICAMNLEYYLVENFGTGYGPYNADEHARQRAKVSKALSKIKADIYGLVEVEQGQSAIGEIASDLTKNTGRNYTFVDDGRSSSGSYTKSCFVYCSDVVEPIGNYKYSNSEVSYRKYMMAFKEKATGEIFIYSINHFKAKAGSGTGDNADQNDGQGNFNAARINEAKAVLDLYDKNKSYFGDEDILIMGDLNAYGKEDPIRTLTNGGMTDLHRFFHADSSYSYTYHGEAGYLDHALCNSTLLGQVTGMTAYHINSDEKDSYTYDSSHDETMFRSSDHDPIIVGLKLDHTSTQLTINNYDVLFDNSNLLVRNAGGGYIRLYDINGRIVREEAISSEAHQVDTNELHAGVYILHIYYNGVVLHEKIMIR